jgi:PAS domain S-box-containing protein
LGQAPTNVQVFLDHLTHDQLIDRLRLALAGASLGIWDWDLRDDSVQFDSRWCEMLGLDHTQTPMELRTWSSRVHPEDISACYDDIRAHIEGRTEVYENIHRMRHANGEWVWILDRGRISGRDDLGRPIRFTGTHFDVTATERARLVLAQQERLLQDLVTNLPWGVAMVDRQLQVLSASPRWAHAHGLAGVPLHGRSIEQLLPGGPALWSRRLHAAVAGGRAGADAEELSDRSGRRRFLRWELVPWLTPEGEVGGALHLSEDVSDQVQARQAAHQERELRHTALHLLTGGLAHELNSPLQVVLSEVEVLEQVLAAPPETAEALSRGLREGLRAIGASTGRAAVITQALRTLSQDSEGQPQGPVGVARLLRDAEALSRSRLESGGARLRVDQPPDALHAVGRPAGLLQAVLALLHAAHNQRCEDITLRAESTADHACIEVHTSGPGGPPCAYARLAADLVEREGGALRRLPPSQGPQFTLELRRT